MTTSSNDDGAMKRDAVLRRMLATPKPGKDGKNNAEPKSDVPKRPVKGRKP